ncbi:MAG: S9 family peptidase [Congregibacter sp.]|nr:S9 family peptidase [Congregibacter sp.]
MRYPSLFKLAMLLLLPLLVQAESAERRPIAIEDIYRIQEVTEVQTSPDGRWIAYTATAASRETDEFVSAISMVNWEGTENVRLTHGKESAYSPRWSPDGKYLAFLSASGAEGLTQLWLLDRRGGSARALTDVRGSLSEYRWSPDSRRMVLVMTPGAAAQPQEPGNDLSIPYFKEAAPVVIRRSDFKVDVAGYLDANAYTRLFLLDVASRKIEPLTHGNSADDASPAWSPDGKTIAYASHHGNNPQATGMTDILLIDAKSGAIPRKFVSSYTPDGAGLSWSPDGQQLAYLIGSHPRFYAYGQDRLAVTPVDGGTPRMLAESLDRGVIGPEFSANGKAITFLYEDNRRAYAAEVSLPDGKVNRLTQGEFVPIEYSRAGGHTAVIAASDQVAPEVFALEKGTLRKLTSLNDALLSEIQLGAVEDMNFTSKDGTAVSGLMIKPPNYDASKKYPTIVWIHGGPKMQDDHALRFDLYPLQMERQLLAAQGYVVLAINYRGSTGRGADFQRAIFADWGNKEVADLLAGVDYAVAKGIADPDLLGIGGWSYGGILTDYTIASDKRFKAAISGAGMAHFIAAYGSDSYTMQYNNELGPPWENTQAWIDISYPFFHADRIKTPTLFISGESDFNVPIVGSEQMFEALTTLGVPTELVIYPKQFHILTHPSYVHDRMLRYYAWFDTYMKPD